MWKLQLLREKEHFALAGVAHLVGVSSNGSEDCGFDPWSVHIQEGNQLMFLSYIDVSLSPPPSPFLSLSLKSNEKNVIR